MNNDSKKRLLRAALDVVPKEFSELLFAKIEDAETTEEAYELFLLAMLAVYADAVDTEIDFLKAKAAEAPADALVSFKGACEGVAEAMGRHFEEATGMTTNALYAVFCQLSGREGGVDVAGGFKATGGGSSELN